MASIKTSNSFENYNRRYSEKGWEGRNATDTLYETNHRRHNVREFKRKAVKYINEVSLRNNPKIEDPRIQAKKKEKDIYKQTKQNKNIKPN